MGWCSDGDTQRETWYLCPVATQLASSREKIDLPRVKGTKGTPAWRWLPVLPLMVAPLES